jgi:hypothetical protein
VNKYNNILEAVSKSERKNFVSKLKDLFNSIGYKVGFNPHSVFRIGRSKKVKGKVISMDSNSIQSFLNKVSNFLKSGSDKLKDLINSLSNFEQIVVFSKEERLYVVLKKEKKKDSVYVPTIIVGNFSMNKENTKFINLDTMSIKETIKKVDSKYVVYPKRGGKRLGTHLTKKKAQKQLAAIEISKKLKESINNGLSKVSEKTEFLRRVLEFVKSK